MFAKNKQFKRQDFVFENGWFEQKLKLPGSLHQQQYQISDSQQCDIYLFDSNAGVFVDDCKYCFIFIGPSQSSVFIRDCHYLNVVCLTKQFRMRDCTNCRIWLWCQSKAVIQSSYDIVFSCFPASIGYQQLLSQMKELNLKLWDNNWFDIYDFTPLKYSKQIPNHRLAITTPQQQQTILKKCKSKLTQNLPNLTLKKQIVPYIQGNQYCQNNGFNSYSVVVIYPVPDCGVGLSVLQTRVREVIQQLVPYVNQKYLGSMALFAKVKVREVQKWKELTEARVKIIAVIDDHKAKEILEGTVFVPFSDERQ